MGKISAEAKAERERNIRALADAGMRRQEVAEALGLSKSTVQRYLNERARHNCNKHHGACAECGGTTRRHGAERCRECHLAHGEAQRAAAVFLYEQGVDIETIAVTIGTTRQGVHSRLTKARSRGELKTYRIANVVCAHTELAERL